ncbi:MAG TPA: hypothetical protein VF015_01140 [Acidimicrobiales bacterium]
MLEVDDLILVSVDDHLIEPPDLFVNHLDARYLDRAPKLVRNGEGSDVWTFGKVVMETAALNAVAGRPKEEYGMEPQSRDEVRPGCYDVHERVKDMDAGGVLASMNFPPFPTFTARTFFHEDVELSNALVRAYNDYPHSDSMWPTAPEELGAVFAANDVPDDHVRKMTHENAMRWYSFDPFAHVPKDEAPVGALRGRAGGHDVSIVSRSTRVRTPDQKLEGFRSRARRAVAAGAPG